MTSLKPEGIEAALRTHKATGGNGETRITAAIRAYLAALPFPAEDVAEVVAKLQAGVTPTGLHEDNETELFDIEGANDDMSEAATLLLEVAAERDELRGKWIAADEGEKLQKEFLAIADAKWTAAEASASSLREALKPFAEFAGPLFSLNRNASEPFFSIIDQVGTQCDLSVGDFFRARAALTGGKDGK